MTNILIPTDFSENAWNAISYGIRFFENEPANFYLLHVSLLEREAGENPVTANGILFHSDHLIGIKDRLKKVSQKINDTFPDTRHNFYALQEHSFFIDGIKAVISHKAIDFIVMGTKGASGLKEAIVGTRTSEVITRVKCPVLVIPEKAKYNPPKQIAFPTDFNSYYRNKILNTLAEVIARNNSSVRVLHLTKKGHPLTELQKKNQNYLRDFLEGSDYSFHLLAANTIEDGLQTFIKDRNIDMITMVAKNLNFVQRLLFEPTVSKISYHAEIPFLVLHE